MATGFIWYELMTSDLDAAEKFYSAVIGWTMQEFPDANMRYVVVNAGERGIGGLMTIPNDAAAMGAQPAWVGYIHSKDIDKATASLKAAGGHVFRPPEDIPGVGRFSVVSDPQGAMFMLLQPNGPDQEAPPAGTPGCVGWRELMTSDWQKAFDFYAGQFGWTKDQAVDMGEVGTYQLFRSGGDAAAGGMMNRPPHIPMSYWGFYFNVDSVDAAIKRVKGNGGTVTFGPTQVPGGQWIVSCQDPQGAHFSMVSNDK